MGVVTIISTALNGYGIALGTIAILEIWPGSSNFTPLLPLKMLRIAS